MRVGKSSGILAAICAVSFWSTLGNVATADDDRTPRFRVDASWPRPLPNDPATHKPWVTGEVAGTCVDSHDHIFTVNRGNLIAPEDVIAVASPPVLEFDRQGNVVNAWGDRNVLPNGLHGCFVDFQDNVYIAGNGDGIVQKYSHDGRHLLLQIGTRGVCDSANGTCGNPGANMSTTRLNQPANMTVDPANGDIYIADGYGNHRVVVFNRNGVFLRQWGNSGLGPGQFQPNDGGHPHCIVMSAAGLLYACDRGSDRIQVFEKNPRNCTGQPPNRVCQPLRIISVVPGRGQDTAGSAWDVGFSKDRQQTFMFDVDGGDEVLWTFDRAAGVILAGFGRPGHQAGEFTFLHSIVLDSHGNMFLGETIGGRRVQKFVPAGEGEGEGGDQGEDEGGGGR
jgi:DNA-binding beta-propeller fold protein YncE